MRPLRHLMKCIKAKGISYDTKHKRDKADIKYIVIHYTGNRNDTAENNAKYFAFTNTRSAGAHFFVDRTGNVVKSIPMERTAWAVGGAKYTDCGKTGGGKFYGKCTNYNSVSIELCDIVDQYPSAAQIVAVRETIAYIRKYCPHAKTVVRHFDVTGKHCPASMMDDKTWGRFLKDIGEERGD